MVTSTQELHEAIVIRLCEQPETWTKDRAISNTLDLPVERVRGELEALESTGVVELHDLFGTYYARLTGKFRL